MLAAQWGLVGHTVLSTASTSPGRHVHHLLASVGSTPHELAVKVATAGPDEVPPALDVQAWVAARATGLAAPVWPTRDGELGHDAAGRRVTITSWVPGRMPDDAPSTWAAIGVALARLHTLPVVAREFAIPVRAAADELGRRSTGYPFGVDFAALVPRVQTLPSRPRATVHGEVNPANVIVRPNGEITFLDWDQAGAAPVSLDLGHPLICVFLGLDLCWHADLAAAFYGGYRSGSDRLLPTAADVFTAGLLHAMRYLHHADRQARWERIRWAVAHEHEVLEAYG